MLPRLSFVCKERRSLYFFIEIEEEVRYAEAKRQLIGWTVKFVETRNK